jgi:hypothetical protein
MEKTAQQQGSQGTLVNEDESVGTQGHQNQGNVTSFSPAQSDTPQKDSEQMTHGEEGYPGSRPEGINQPPGLTPPAGDVDPDSTKSAQETGQDGDTSKDSKKKAFNYSG